MEIKTSQNIWSLTEGKSSGPATQLIETDKPANLAGVTEPIKGEIRKIGIPTISQTDYSDPAS